MFHMSQPWRKFVIQKQAALVLWEFRSQTLPTTMGDGRSKCKLWNVQTPLDYSSGTRATTNGASHLTHRNDWPPGHQQWSDDNVTWPNHCSIESIAWLASTGRTTHDGKNLLFSFSCHPLQKNNPLFHLFQTNWYDLQLLLRINHVVKNMNLQQQMDTRDFLQSLPLEEFMQMVVPRELKFVSYDSRLLLQRIILAAF